MEHSKKFQRVKDWYDQGIWKPFQVKNAVKRGWITPGEYKEITGEEYDA